MLPDRDPSEPPNPKGVRFSVYNDPSGFMEIEAAGGCPKIISPDTSLSTTVTTTYSLLGVSYSTMKNHLHG